MLPKDKYLEFHSMFYDVKVNPAATEEPPQGEYIPYDSYDLPAETTRDAEWHTFHTMARNFIKELKNAINLFLTDIHRLDAWAKVNEQCPEEYKFDLCIEILDSPGRSLLHRPYIVQQRFIYVSSMLLHLTEMILDTDPPDQTPLNERSIGIERFRRKFANLENPGNSGDFMNSVLAIDGEDSSETTRNFRNLDTHRIPPHIEIGLSPCVNIVEGKVGQEREVDKESHYSITKTIGSKTISYDFCFRQPAKINELVPLLYKQHDICVKSFYVFWDWLTELVERWRRERPDGAE